jgi:hypothetical protein
MIWINRPAIHIDVRQKSDALDPCLPSVVMGLAQTLQFAEHERVVIVATLLDVIGGGRERGLALARANPAQRFDGKLVRPSASPRLGAVPLVVTSQIRPPQLAAGEFKSAWGS